ncbi:hypothetical protein SCUCBS95973_009132 [Sporothrix curviconia]|uniref:Major facilitator superfamily (MFS) profile domain-containing protein n=1 Tax=Sporothrix curviconia TaxID=1260050 RepID=A0ABP0CSE3_9PEZI
MANNTEAETFDDGAIEKQTIDHAETASVFEEDAAEAHRVLRKIDLRLIPIVLMLYTLTFLDRVNIGNAAVWNLETDLHMKGYDYNIVVLVFYIPYILLEIPSNMIINRVQPRYWIGFLALGWGLSVTFAGFSKSMGGLGCLFLIGSWYRREELIVRLAWFMVSNDVAGVLSGLLGAGLGSLNGTGGYSGWCWIFWVEGAMTCVAAIVALFFLPSFPEESTFLTPEEKAWYLRRLKRDDNNREGEQQKMELRGVLRSLRDWKVLTSGVLYLSVCVTAYSLSVFQPAVLTSFGWSSLKSNLLTAPVRAVSGIISVLVALWSDKVRRRGVFCLAGFLISIMGMLFVMLFTNGNLRYMGFYFASFGIYICQPLVIGWCVNQVIGYTKRGTVTAFAVSCGQIGGIISALVFPSKNAPQYVPGISTCIGFQVLGILAVLNMWWWCRWENKQRDAGKRDHLRSLSAEEQEKLGELHPDFRYML